MYGKIPAKRAGFITLPAKPQLERFWWQEYAVSLYLVPPAWAGAVRLTEYVHRLAAGEGPLWIAPELEPYFAGWKQPLPEPELAAFLLCQQPFRENMVILSETAKQAAAGKRRGADVAGAQEAAWRRYVIDWQERFLESCFRDLNGLYLAGACEAETEEFLEWIYEQSGLAACVTDCLPDTDGRKTVVVDLCRNGRVLTGRLAPGSLYLDLTSNPEKQRILKEKRKDISYISVRNYLDTVFKARYNAI